MDRELACNEVVELVTAYIDGALDPQTRAQFEAHLERCDGCKNYVEQMRTTITLTSGVGEELPASLQEQLLQAFRGWRAN